MNSDTRHTIAEVVGFPVAGALWGTVAFLVAQATHNPAWGFAVLGLIPLVCVLVVLRSRRFRRGQR